MNNQTIKNNDYKVADMTLASFGRKEIELAEAEMPALMTLPGKIQGFTTLGRCKHSWLYSHDYSNCSPNGNPC